MKLLNVPLIQTFFGIKIDVEQEIIDKLYELNEEQLDKVILATNKFLKEMKKIG